MTRPGQNPPINKLWILGRGKFGRLALKRITSHMPDVEITVIDSTELITDTDTDRVTAIREDGIAWLVQKMRREESADIIIPAIPVHVVAEWLKLSLAGEYTVTPVPLPDHLISRLPHPLRGGEGQVFVSHADFLCPDNCAEPQLVCSHTGKKRGEDMFRLIANLPEMEFTPLVVRSYQLFPGVGGIYPKDMWNLHDRILNSLGKPFLIATACRCHGVVDGLQLDKT